MARVHAEREQATPTAAHGCPEESRWPRPKRKDASRELPCTERRLACPLRKDAKREQLPYRSPRPLRKDGQMEQMGGGARGRERERERERFAAWLWQLRRRFGDYCEAMWGVGCGGLDVGCGNLGALFVAIWGVVWQFGRVFVAT